MPRLAIVGEGPGLSAWSALTSSAGHDVVVVNAAEGLLPEALLPELASCVGAIEVSTASAEVRLGRLEKLARRIGPRAWVATTLIERTATAIMAETGAPALLVGDWTPPAEADMLEIAFAEGLSAELREGAREVLGSLRPLAIVPDQVGLIFARTLALILNEAATALQEGVASAEDIDQAMRLGAGYPRGPLAWADQIGLARVVAVLDALQRELGEDRYRVAPLLRRKALAGTRFHGAVPSAR